MSVLSKKQNDEDGIYYWLETVELWEMARQSLQGSLYVVEICMKVNKGSLSVSCQNKLLWASGVEKSTENI